LLIYIEYQHCNFANFQSALVLLHFKFKKSLFPPEKKGGNKNQQVQMIQGKIFDSGPYSSGGT